MNRGRIKDSIPRDNHNIQITPLACLAKRFNLHLLWSRRLNALQIRHRLRILRRLA